MGIRKYEEARDKLTYREDGTDSAYDDETGVEEEIEDEEDDDSDKGKGISDEFK